MLVALCGGVGAARFLSGLTSVMDPTDITAIVNTGDDTVIHGLHIAPDLDTITYTLAGRDNKETGWGLKDETWVTMSALEALGGEAWFRLGDQDLATHLFRTGALREGSTLSEVTAALARAHGLTLTMLPMSNDPVATRLTLVESGEEVSFQDYFVRLRHSVAVASVRFSGAEHAAPAPGVLEAIEAADQIVICPSNPIVSLGPILAVPRVREALRSRREATVAISPIVAGRALKGPADRLLEELGYEASVVAIARLYAPIASTLVIDVADSALAAQVRDVGMEPICTETVMSTPQIAHALALTVREVRHQ